MLNLNKVGRPLCLINGGKYKGHVVSVSDNLVAADDGDHTLIKEFKQLRIANDSTFQQVPDTTNGRDTRRILNESHSVTYFPHSASGRIKYLLIDYLGIDKKMINKFRKSNSRWATIHKNYPQIYMLEREIGLLNEDDNL